MMSPFWYIIEVEYVRRWWVWRQMIHRPYKTCDSALQAETLCAFYNGSARTWHTGRRYYVVNKSDYGPHWMPVWFER